jgi:hypothetical protein
MADFNLIIDNDEQMDLVATTEDKDLNSLLADDVVLEWLLQLEAESPANQPISETPSARLQAC